MRVLTAGEVLEAPGILRNPVPVEALYDRTASHEATLRNLLQRKGYRDLDEVRASGLAQAVILLMEQRGLAIEPETRARILACRDHATLEGWVLAAARVERAVDLFERESKRSRQTARIAKDSH